jgi:hypothetical protein
VLSQCGGSCFIMHLAARGNVGSFTLQPLSTSSHIRKNCGRLGEAMNAPTPLQAKNDKSGAGLPITKSPVTACHLLISTHFPRANRSPITPSPDYHRTNLLGRNSAHSFLLASLPLILLRNSGVIPKYDAMLCCGTQAGIAGYFFIKRK